MRTANIPAPTRRRIKRLSRKRARRWCWSVAFAAKHADWPSVRLAFRASLREWQLSARAAQRIES